MNILITGASGFIGKNLTKYLSTQYHLFTPTHEQLDLLNEDKVLRFFKKQKIDTVIHCAVIGGNRKDQHVENMFYDNMRIFFNIARCNKHFSRMINIGSGAEYDKRFPIKKAKEDDFGKRIPADEYGLYKYICAQHIAETNNIVDLRVFGVFGEGEDYRHRFISNIICRIIFDLPIVINQDLYFDYIDVRDVVKIIDHFIMHEPRYRAYNIGTGVRRNLKNIALEINTAVSRQKKIIIKKRGLGREYTADISRLKKELLLLHFTPFTRSIEDLYQWYLTRKKQIEPDSLL